MVKNKSQISPNLSINSLFSSLSVPVYQTNILIKKTYKENQLAATLLRAHQEIVANKTPIICYLVRLSLNLTIR